MLHAVALHAGAGGRRLVASTVGDTTATKKLNATDSGNRESRNCIGLIIIKPYTVPRVPGTQVRKH